MRATRMMLGLAVAGCVATSLACSSDDHDRRVERTHTSTGDVVVTHGRDLDRDPDRTRVVRHDINADIPATAREVRSVSGRDAITYKPDRRGTVYICDTDSGSLIWSGRVERDQRVMVDPTNDSVTLDGQRVVDRRLRDGHTYRLYFDDSSR